MIILKRRVNMRALFCLEEQILIIRLSFDRI